jgi:hypothetical protein
MKKQQRHDEDLDSDEEDDDTRKQRVKHSVRRGVKSVKLKKELAQSSVTASD